MQKMTEEEILNYIPEEEKKEIILKNKKKEYLNSIEDSIDYVINRLGKIKNIINSGNYNKIDKECIKISKSLYRSAEVLEKLPTEIGIRTDKCDVLLEDRNYIKFELLDDKVFHLILKDSLPQTVNYNKITEQKEMAYYDFYKLSYISSFANEFENGRYIYYDEKVVIYIVNHYISEVDIDNYYYKYLIDAIKTFLLPDDSPKWCSMYADAVEDTRRYAEAFIIPSKSFINCIAKYKIGKED